MNNDFAKWWKWFTTETEESGYDEESEDQDIAADAYEAGYKDALKSNRVP